MKLLKIRRLVWMFVLATLSYNISSAHAHLKWFVDGSKQHSHIYENVTSYSLAWIGIALILILAAILIDKIFPKISASWESNKIEKYATSILGVFLGTSLLISALNGTLFSMNIKNDGALNLALMLEGFIGISLIVGLAVRQASLLLIALWITATQLAGLIVTLENLWIPGAALFFILRGRPVMRYSREDVFSALNTKIRQAHAMTFLRMFIGANLIFLGFSEKIMVPELGLAFLQDHHWNFMAKLGVAWFTDEVFVFSAGAVEIILGLFLLAGYVVRLTAVALAVLFLIPPFFMGAEEMIGHIPHISIVVMLILFGRGHTAGVAFSGLADMLTSNKRPKGLEEPVVDMLIRDKPPMDMGDPVTAISVNRVKRISQKQV